MKAGTRYSLQGAFRCQLLSGNKVVSDTDWFSNFITPTGLTYPTVYPFVDCFQFLSLGNNGAVLNYGADSGNATTGLASPIVTFNTTNGVQSGQYIGWPGYEADGSSCGTVLTQTGPRFFRAWLIPSGDETNTVNEGAGFLNIQELMVSPGSGSDPTGASAFSRIVRNLTIPNGFKAIISYQLSINLENTGRTMFGTGTFQTGNADVSQDFGIVSQWGNLSGYYRQVYFGLDCIDENGMHYTPDQFGEGMEPYIKDFTPYAFYLSPDNAAFDVSVSGGFQTDTSLAYQADGLMEFLDGISFTPIGNDIGGDSAAQLNAFYYGPVRALSNNIQAWPNTPYNIRIGGNNNIKTPLLGSYNLDSSANILPSNFNYQVFNKSVNQPISFATPGASGFDPTQVNYGQKAVQSSKIYLLPFVQTGQNAITGRTKTVTRKTLFSPVSSLGYNTRFGSLVFAFNQNPGNPPSNVYYPYVDCLFYDSSGRSLMQHYRYISGLVLTQRGTGIADAYVNIVNPNNTQNVNGNMQVFTSRKTYQGGYNPAYINGIDTSSSNAVLTNENNNIYSNFGYFCLFSGQLPSTTTGSFQMNINGGSGWGGVYGFVTNNPIGGSTNSLAGIPFDLGLADHSLSQLTQPASSGTIYWPTISSGNNLQLTFTGVKFYYPSVGVIADTGWFDVNHQVIGDVFFTDMQIGCNPNPTGFAEGNISYFINNPTGFQNVLNTMSASNGYTPPSYGHPAGWGYFISTARYYYQPLTSSDIVNFVANTNIPITGFIDTGNTASCNVNSSIPASYLKAIVRTGSVPNINNNGFVCQNLIAVTGFFTGLFDRGYTTGINNVPITGNQSLEFFISGYSGASPLYLTYIGYDYTNGWPVAHSYLNPLVATTQFCRPSGYIHSKDAIVTPTGTVGYRLLPNYAIANNTNTNTYTAQTGGALPALSFDNGLELYMDISWNSPCGGAQNCTDDPSFP